ncbi:TPA: winged helix-turn-helix transcriptional regulator [Streptococcus suis]|nr:winged helix-turn-helix transcriptional regulator [Streptococcus suis]HEL2006960.1 winged helix-turn-helix transcriptional regulator [Streptococcus suis]HEL2059868.1 winged helix-turn-helix transcriptional regulator [Streptococcus suis]HEL2395874.1 winged helix-turn-helix transcriptional regulator [Streptococcus suis]HEL9617459.1 winged helix-turn-helix transcriptional regulator [Streptococcus suis]
MGHTIADFRNLLNQIEQISETIAKEYDVEHLAGPQGWALRFIAERSDLETFVKDIEAELKISKSVASNLVKRMEKNDFIQVLPSQFDRRYKQLVLTEKGRSKICHLKAFHEEMHHSLFWGIQKEEFDLVRQVADQLKENIQHYKEKNHV